MNQISQRVSRCFHAVFPRLNEVQISTASTDSLHAWDSIAHVTLLAAISEEFQIDIEAEAFEELVSFPEVVSYVERRVPA
jgi:acyl carrier protein